MLTHHDLRLAALVQSRSPAHGRRLRRAHSTSQTMVPAQARRARCTHSTQHFLLTRKRTLHRAHTLRANGLARWAMADRRRWVSRAGCLEPQAHVKFEGVGDNSSLPEMCLLATNAIVQSNAHNTLGGACREREISWISLSTHLSEGHGAAAQKARETPSCSACSESRGRSLRNAIPNWARFEQASAQVKGCFDHRPAGLFFCNWRDARVWVIVGFVGCGLHLSASKPLINYNQRNATTCWLLQTAQSLLEQAAQSSQSVCRASRELAAALPQDDLLHHSDAVRGEAGWDEEKKRRCHVNGAWV